MYYDVLKYHLVTTLEKAIDRQQNVTNEFRKLSNNPEFKVNFYYGLNTTRLQCFNISRNKAIISDLNYRKLVPVPFQVTRQQYIANKCGWMGCVSSLLGCINYAKMMNWPYLFVFEDDICLYSNFTNHINIAMNFCPDYTIVLLDHTKYFRNKTYQPVNEYFNKINHYINGGHAYLINSKYYDTIISWINNKNVILNRDVLYLRFNDKIYLLNKKICSLTGFAKRSAIQNGI